MVGHYLDNLGLLIEQGLLERAPAEAFLGLSAQGMWDKLGPYIRDERSTKPSRATYQCNFEKFVTPHPRRRWWRRG